MTLAVRGRSHECRTAKSEEWMPMTTHLLLMCAADTLSKAPATSEQYKIASSEGKGPSEHRRQQCIPGPTTRRLRELTWAKYDGRMQSRRKQFAQETFHGLGHSCCELNAFVILPLRPILPLAQRAYPMQQPARRPRTGSDDAPRKFREGKGKLGAASCQDTRWQKVRATAIVDTKIGKLTTSSPGCAATENRRQRLQRPHHCWRTRCALRRATPTWMKHVQPKHQLYTSDPWTMCRQASAKQGRFHVQWRQRGETPTEPPESFGAAAGVPHLATHAANECKVFIPEGRCNVGLQLGTPGFHMRPVSVLRLRRTRPRTMGVWTDVPTLRPLECAGAPCQV